MSHKVGLSYSSKESRKTKSDCSLNMGNLCDYSPVRLLDTYPSHPLRTPTLAMHELRGSTSWGKNPHDNQQNNWLVSVDHRKSIYTIWFLLISGCCVWSTWLFSLEWVVTNDNGRMIESIEDFWDSKMIEVSPFWFTKYCPRFEKGLGLVANKSMSSSLIHMALQELFIKCIRRWLTKYASRN